MCQYIWMCLWLCSVLSPCLSLALGGLSWEPHPRVDSYTSRSITTHTHTYHPPMETHSNNPPPSHCLITSAIRDLLGRGTVELWDLCKLNHHRSTAHTIAHTRCTYVHVYLFRFFSLLSPIQTGDSIFTFPSRPALDWMLLARKERNY